MWILSYIFMTTKSLYEETSPEVNHYANSQSNQLNLKYDIENIIIFNIE